MALSEVSEKTQEKENSERSASIVESQEAPKEETQSEPLELLKIRASSELIRCNQLYHQGAYEEALSGFQALVEQLKDDKVLANVGYTLQALGQHQEAVKAFDRYLETFIARHHAWKALCFSHYHLQDYENMTRCAREAIRWDIRLNTPDDYSWQQMATAHFLMGDYSTALKAARKASKLNEHNPFSKYYEACVLSAYAEGAEIEEEGLLSEPPTYQKALELLREALEIQPNLRAELKSEGFLDRVFLLLEEQEQQEEQEAPLDQSTR